MNNLLYAQIFDNKIYTCGGYDFQYLFFEIMKNKYKEQFVMPKPQGRYGDKKMMDISWIKANILQYMVLIVMI